jgi:hypothetical protein
MKPMLTRIHITGIPGLARDFLAGYSIRWMAIAYGDRE